MPRIHPTAIVSDRATLADDAEVGAYALVGAEVTVGAGTVIGPHTRVEGPTTIGERNHFYGHASVGGPPQDLKYHGEHTALKIGDDNTFRECVTLNRGTQVGGGVTRIGDHNDVMAYTLVAHACRVTCGATGSASDCDTAAGAPR